MHSSLFFLCCKQQTHTHTPYFHHHSNANLVKILICGCDFQQTTESLIIEYSNNHISHQVRGQYAQCYSVAGSSNVAFCREYCGRLDFIIIVTRITIIIRRETTNPAKYSSIIISEMTCHCTAQADTHT